MNFPSFAHLFGVSPSCKVSHQIERKLDLIMERLRNMAIDYTSLEAAVEANHELVAKISAQLAGLEAAIREIALTVEGEVQAKLTALADKIVSDNKAEEDAIIANPIPVSANTAPVSA